MTVDQFLASDAARRRYWVGSHLGWRAFAAAEPERRPPRPRRPRGTRRRERGHHPERRWTARARGKPPRRRAPRHDAARVLHALRTGLRPPRPRARVEADNPWITVPENIALGPDGDVLPETTEGFRIPACSVCGGMLKPDVVFFGEFIPAGKFREAEQLVQGSDALDHRRLVARGEFRHPAARAGTAPAPSRHHRQPRRDAGRRPRDGEDRRGDERSAARARGRTPRRGLRPRLHGAPSRARLER